MAYKEYAASKNRVLNDVRGDDIYHDPYGTSLAWVFAVCGVLEALGEYIPPHWGYSRGPSAPLTFEEIRDFPDEYERERWLLEDLAPDNGLINVEDLLYAGEVLHRYIRILGVQGRTY